MSTRPVKARWCPNRDCTLHGRLAQGNVVVHSFYRTTQGRRRRYRCTRCGRTFCSTMGTPYYRLHKPRALFDEVARMSVDGVGKSAIARIKQIAWNTAARWLALAAAFARRFNDQMQIGRCSGECICRNCRPMRSEASCFINRWKCGFTP